MNDIGLLQNRQHNAPVSYMRGPVQGGLAVFSEVVNCHAHLSAIA